MKQPCILITGASGFSGRHLVQYLTKQKYKIIAHCGRTPVVEVPAKVKTIYGDLSLKQNLDCRPDVIVHLAAQSPAPGIKVTDIYKNIPIIYNIIQHAQKVGVKKIIYFSSTSMYGNVRGGMLYENSPVINPDFYGQTKLVCEGLLVDSKIPTVSLRLPGIVGLGAQRNWLSQVMHKAKAGEIVNIYNSAGWFNNAVHIRFLCELVDHLIKTNFAKPYDAFLVASTGCITLVDVVTRVMGGSRRIHENKEFAKESFVISVAKLRSIMEPWTIEQTIHAYVEEENKKLKVG